MGFGLILVIAFSYVKVCLFLVISLSEFKIMSYKYLFKDIKYFHLLMVVKRVFSVTLRSIKWKR